MSLTRLAFASIALFSVRAGAQTGPPIPAAYQSLYTELQGDITSFAQVISSSWNGSHYPTIFSSQLLTANSDQGSSLLGSNYYTGTVLPELQEQRALGVGAVTVHINFPILYQPYYTNQQDFQNFVSFYQQLAKDIRANGLKMIVETTVASASAGTNGTGYLPYYATLSWDQYMAGRAQQAVNVAQMIQPDYMSVMTEPDSESQNSSQSTVDTPSGALQELQTILAALKTANSTNVPVGAGAGTWIASFTTYIQNFLTTSISYLDLHMYSVSNAFPENALTAATMAHAAGLPVTMSETWCKKISAAQLGGSALNNQDVDALGTFSFWEPLDEVYLQTLVNMSQAGQFMFISPFWTGQYFAYLDYAQDGGQATPDILTAAQSAAGAARKIGAFTPVGTQWESLILPSPDRTSPQVPTPPSVGQYTQTLVQLLWNPTTDNVGVAGYHLFRNGTLLTTSSQTGYTDSSVSPAVTYSYQLQAFDASGNLSALSAPAVVTTRAVPDHTPPSTPINVKATSLTDQEIQVTWTPSTDNVSVVGYRVYRGSTANSLVLFASVSTNSYTESTSIYPNTTYYYAVEAFDPSYNFSPQSAVMAVTSLADTTPPTAPTSFAANGTGCQQVNLSWGPSSDNIRVGGYTIYRGKTAAPMIAVGSTTATAFTDTLGLQPNLTYYYAVAAFDEARNYSAQTPVTAASTLRDTQPPTVPQNVAPAAPSATQINLTWLPSTDNVAVYAYRIYRGTSSQTLTLIGSSAVPSYSDTLNLRASQTYYYAVAATDASGNASANSAVVSITTP